MSLCFLPKDERRYEAVLPIFLNGDYSKVPNPFCPKQHFPQLQI